MDRSATFRSERATAMRPPRCAALDLLLSVTAGEHGEPASAAEARRAVLGLPVFRQPSHGRHAGSRPQAHPAIDADSGNRSSLSETESESAGARPRGLPLPPAGCLDRAAQPRLEHRYYVPSDAWRLPLFGGRHGLVQPLRAQLGTVQHHGDRLLSGCAAGGVPLRPTRNLELRSRLAVHRGRVSHAPKRPRHPNQHGRPWSRSGQRLHRASVAQLEVRADLPRRLHQRRRPVSGAGPLLPFLQPPASAPGARLPNPGRSVSASPNKETVVAIMGGFAPHAPQDLSLFFSRVDGFASLVIRDCPTMEGLDRRIGQRRDATRAPIQARSGWRPSGRLLDSPPHHLRSAEILSKQPGPPHWSATRPPISLDPNICPTNPTVVP